MLCKIYTDGSCSKNPGPGGYAFILLSSRDSVLLQVSGCEVKTTNNRMELKAILSAIKHICNNLNYNRKENIIIIYSDSAYCINALSQNWLENWEKNDWKNKKGENVKNVELWKDLFFLLKKIRAKIQYEKVQGHSGNVFNDRVDKLAKEATQRALERSKRQESEA